MKSPSFLIGKTGETRHPASIVDNTYGSRNFVSKIRNCKKQKCLPKDLGGHEIRSAIIVDMIESKNLKFTKESQSTRRLVNKFVDIAKRLGHGDKINSTFQSVEDDHIPFLKAGVEAINVIDFNNLQHWHEPSDLPDTVSKQSIETSGKIVLSLALLEAL